MPARWTTDEQVEFLEKYIPAFCASQTAGTVSSEFMPMINREWFAVYPIPQDDPNYAHKHAKRCDQLYSWFYNDHTARKAPGENDLVQLVGKGNPKKKALTAVQIFSKLYYDTHVKPLVDAELDALRKASPTGKLEKGAHLAVVKHITKKSWELASDEVREEVEKQRLESKEEEEKSEKQEKEELTHLIPDLIERVGKQLLELGWTGTFMVGGLDHKTGQLKTHFYDAGVNRAGLSFAESLPNHENTLTGPFSAFVKDFYRATTNKTAEAVEPISKSIVVVEKGSASTPTRQQSPEKAKGKKGHTKHATPPTVPVSPGVANPGTATVAGTVSPAPVAPVAGTISPVISPAPVAPVAPVGPPVVSPVPITTGPGTIAAASAVIPPVTEGVPIAPAIIQAPSVAPIVPATVAPAVIDPQLIHLSPYALSPSGLPMSFGPSEPIPEMANAAVSSVAEPQVLAPGKGKRKRGRQPAASKGADDGPKTQAKKRKTKAANDPPVDSQAEKENVPPVEGAEGTTAAEGTTSARRSGRTRTAPKDTRNMIGK
ncbi:hypothetical protein VKT23_010824 [Stygiomarasmius scandens]|uniref:Uncharacterized protein n=1 Tax=Marasmiellus scandens TaxID=2682957 RepID=A0ABR1JEE3_9AGAR